MGVVWGIVEHPAKFTAKQVEKAYRPIASCAMRREFSVLCGDERYDLRRLPERDAAGRFEVAIAHAKAPALRAEVDALVCDDGTYAQFEQLFDGVELFVPWRTILGTLDAPGTPMHGKRRDSIEALAGAMTARLATWKTVPPKDPHLVKLARELRDAAKLARKARMFIEVSY